MGDYTGFHSSIGIQYSHLLASTLVARKQTEQICAKQKCFQKNTLESLYDFFFPICKQVDCYMYPSVTLDKPVVLEFCMRSHVGTPFLLSSLLGLPVAVL